VNASFRTVGARKAFPTIAPCITGWQNDSLSSDLNASDKEAIGRKKLPAQFSKTAAKESEANGGEERQEQTEELRNGSDTACGPADCFHFRCFS